MQCSAAGGFYSRREAAAAAHLQLVKEAPETLSHGVFLNRQPQPRLAALGL